MADGAVPGEPSDPDETEMEIFERLPSSLPNIGVDLYGFAGGVFRRVSVLPLDD